MIKNADRFRSFERALAKAGQADFRTNIRLVEAIFAEATALGIFPPKDPLDGIEVDIRIAKAVNSVRSTS